MTNLSSNLFDHIPNISRGAIGFDDLFRRLDTLTKTVTQPYPPYNIRKTGDNTYVVEMAVAGFGKQDIELTLEDSELTIKGQVTSDDSSDLIYKGISDRAFTRKFTLADTVEIKNADLINGMLKIWLERLIPENKKPKKIEINESQTTTSKKLQKETS